MFIKWNALVTLKMCFIQTIFIKKTWYSCLGFKCFNKIINKYASEHNLLKKNKLAISGDDIKGINLCLSTKIPDPKFLQQR